MRVKYDAKELTPIGSYFRIPGKKPGPATLPKYSTPVTPRENFLMALRGEKPLWLPDYFDITTIAPACVPDNIARGFVMGAEGANYMEDSQKGGLDAFGVDWEYIPVAGGSMVRPGKPFLEDLDDWKNVIMIPDVDSWDWEGSRKANEEFLKNDDGLLEMWIFTGYFERLISFLEFEDAAVAMIDEDYTDTVHELFDALTQVYKKIAKHYKDDFNCDVLYVHDDWGAQKAPFFSVDTCMEMIVPHMKELVDYTHSLGMYYEAHSCGRNEPLVPCYLAAGADIWSPQAHNDIERIIRDVDGRMMIGLWGNDPEADPETAYKEGADFAEKYSKDYCAHPVYHCDLFDINSKWREGMYVESRKILGCD